MVMKTKVRKIGNSYGVVLPKEALHAMKVKEGDTLYITTYKGRGENGSVVVVKDWRP